jgi:hypothetical protein
MGEFHGVRRQCFGPAAGNIVRPRQPDNGDLKEHDAIYIGDKPDKLINFSIYFTRAKRKLPDESRPGFMNVGNPQAQSRALGPCAEQARPRAATGGHDKPPRETGAAIPADAHASVKSKGRLRLRSVWSE